MKTYFSEKKCVAQIRKNMTAAGCSEMCSSEHIQEAISNYHRLHAKGVVEIAKLI